MISPVSVLNRIGWSIIIRGESGEEERDALSMIVDDRLDVTSWVEQMPLERGQEIFTRLVESPQEPVKAVFVF